MGSTSDVPLVQRIPLEDVRRLRIFESLDEKILLANQLEVLLDKFYVHLPLKESMLGLRPVQQARLLQAQVEFFPDDYAFMVALLHLSTGLRDFHTMVDMPEPWSRLTAWLPFQIHEYFDDAGAAHYIVREIAPGADLGEDFVSGVEVTHWNGEPMARSIKRLGKLTAGSNHQARCRRAMESLTQRILKYCLPPDEDFVFLTYLGKRGPTDIKLPWFVREAPPPGPLGARVASSVAAVTGLNEHAIRLQWLRKELFTPNQMQDARNVSAIREENPLLEARSILRRYLQTQSLFPESLSFRNVTTPSGTYGYLRISNFMVNDVDGFVREVQRIVGLLPSTGLIIDVRGNPGGAIPAAERILQFFTPNRIEPEPLSLRCTDLTRKLCDTSERWAPWRPSLRLGIITGELFSQGFPLTPVEQANDVGQIYKGPVVLLCDALSYSAADFFIAGFKDHNIGKIIGVDEQTGAGGASMYWHEQLVTDLANASASPLTSLVRGAAMRVALLRSLRVGLKRGMPVEGLGAEIDVSHRYTLNDILHEDADLLNRAGQVLASRP